MRWKIGITWVLAVVLGMGSFVAVGPAQAYGQNTASHHLVRTISGGSVVIDTKYNLMWERKSASASAPDYFERTFTYAEAEKYVANLNATAFGGRTDWRIPSEHELSTLVDLSQPAGTPTIDNAAFPNTGRYFYWTSSDWKQIPYFGRSLTFASGSVFQWSKQGKQHLRAVAGDGWTGRYNPNKPYDPALLHADAKNETVVDDITGLQWEQKSFDGGIPWGSPEATKYYLQEVVNAAKFTMVYPELFLNVGKDVAIDKASVKDTDPAAYLSADLPGLVNGTLTRALESVNTVIGQYAKGRYGQTSPLGPRSMHQLFTIEQAHAYIDWLNNKDGKGYPGGYAGHKDWRLPSADEMLTIADWNRGLPLVKAPFDPNFPSTYWTSDVDPTTGRPFFFCTASLVVTSYIRADYGLFVRAVRGEPKPVQHAGASLTESN